MGLLPQYLILFKYRKYSIPSKEGKKPKSSLNTYKKKAKNNDKSGNRKVFNLNPVPKRTNNQTNDKKKKKQFY